MNIQLFAATAAALVCASPALAQPAGIRDACKQFIATGNNAPVTADWGAYWNWTVIDNGDGTYSVGGKYRYSVGGQWRDAYTNCIIRHRGKHFVLEKLSRIM
jgi:hypothetical protein